MCDTISFKAAATMVFILLIMVPATSFSRENILRGGLSVGLDNDNRSYDTYDDDYRRLLVSPKIEFKSLSEKDSFSLLAQPGIKFDLLDSDTDWDANVKVAADRFVTKFWQLGVSDNFLRSDSQNTDTGVYLNPATPVEDTVSQTTEPQLSDNRYRTRYSRNSLNLYSKYIYREASSFRVGFGYDVLRNDTDMNFSGDSDYDRYTTSLGNEHRYNPRWRSTMGLQYVRGDFTPNETTVDQVSEDVDEYRLQLGLDNDSFIHNPLSLTYSYIETVYDEDASDDTNIHQMRLTWRRDFSPHLYTRLGFGPTYEKTEGNDGNWGENGIGEVNYSLEHGFVNFRVEKTYDVDNFSGSNESGSVDAWNSRLSGNYQLQKDWNLSGYLAYIHEDRQQLATIQSGSGSTQLEDYQNKVYGAGTSLSYSFWQFYNASLAYAYTKKDSDIEGDDYDDHRIVLTLSWEKDLLRW